MTLYETIVIVEDKTGITVTGSTNLSDLGLDSLEFVELLMSFPNIPDEKVPQINTVSELWLAQEGKL